MSYTNDEKAFEEIATVWRNDSSYYTATYLNLKYYSYTALTELEHALQQNAYVKELSLDTNRRHSGSHHVLESLVACYRG